MSIQEKNIAAILLERKRQDKKFGVQTHAPADWLTILGEEVGEVNKAAYEAKFHDESILHYQAELVQVAAVALAMLECYDRIVIKVDAKLKKLRDDLKAEIITPSQYEAALKNTRLKDFILNPNLLINGLGK